MATHRRLALRGDAASLAHSVAACDSVFCHSFAMPTLPFVVRTLLCVYTHYTHICVHARNLHPVIKPLPKPSCAHGYHRVRSYP